MNRWWIAVALGAIAGAAHAEELRIPGAVVECPAWLKKDAPFDVEAFFRMPPKDRNAAPLYLDALAEFGGEIWKGLPAEVKARYPGAEGRGDRLTALSEASRKDPAAADRGAIDAILRDLDAAIRKVAIAQERPECVFAVGITADAALPHAQDARHVVRALVLRAARDLEQGEINRPIRDLETALRLARDLRPRGYLICQLVSAAIDGVALLQIVPAVLAHPSLTAKQCDRLLAVLATHKERGLPLFATGVKGEYVWHRVSLRVFQDAIDTRANAEGHAVDRPIDRLEVARNLMAILGTIELADGTVPHAKTNADPRKPEVTAKLLEGRAGRWPEERRAFDDFARSLASDRLYTHRDRLRVLKRLEAAYLGGDLPKSLILAKLIEPDYRVGSLAFSRVEAYEGATQGLIALRRWRITHDGKDAPDLASACREAGLKSVPPDPFSDGPMKLATIDGQVVVYSIGPDGIDDKALKDSDLGRKPEGDLLFRLPRAK